MIREGLTDKLKKFGKDSWKGVPPSAIREALLEAHDELIRLDNENIRLSRNSLLKTNLD